METSPASEFKHTTLERYPDRKAGITLLDEEPGFTGVYIRNANGGLWPARTVSHTPPDHHKSVCDAWLSHPGVHEDKRSVIPS